MPNGEITNFTKTINETQQGFKTNKNTPTNLRHNNT